MPPAINTIIIVTEISIQKFDQKFRYQKFRWLMNVGIAARP
jgi:hypothetical protein